MKAVILAAGFGKRMMPITKWTAKPAMPILGQPMIARLIAQLSNAGIDSVYVNLHHLPRTVRRAVRSIRNIPIEFSFESSILGTAGALFPWKRHLAHDSFMIINGDIVTDLDFLDLIHYHRDRQADATFVLHPASLAQGFPAIGAKENGQISRFPYSAIKDGDYSWAGTFTGIQIVSPAYLEHIPARRYTTSTENVYPKMIESGCRLQGFRYSGYWNDAGTPLRYFNAHSDLIRTMETDPCNNRESHWRKKEAQCCVRVGTDCSIAESVCFSGMVVLGDRVRIAGGVCLNNVIVWNDIHIPEGSDVSNAIIYKQFSYVKI